MQFSNNSAVGNGGALCADGYFAGYADVRSKVSWYGDGTQFSNNFALFGGAIYEEGGSTVSWDGDDTQFSSNSAVEDGGAIYAEGTAVYSSSLSLDFSLLPATNTTFVNNSANYGGALYFGRSENH